MSRFRDNKFGNRDVRGGLTSNYFVNEKIRAPKVMVINQEGENLGVLSKQQALELAQETELDLVQVGKKDDIVITKMMDFGKFLYTKKKQLSESKKKQKVVQVKEIKLRPNIGDHDYNTKLKRAVNFLQDGKKVKFTLQFRGREFIMINGLGKKIFERIHKDLTEKNLGNLVEEKEQKSRPFWSKIYFLK